MDPAKVQAVTDLSTPRELQCFQGFTSPGVLFEGFMHSALAMSPFLGPQQQRELS